MELAWPDFTVLNDTEAGAVVDFMLDILADVGMRVENEAMCERLADAGAVRDGEALVRFPRSLMEGHLDRQRTAPAEDARPEKREITFTGTVGGYPLRWVDPRDSQIKFQTLAATADLVRLSDWIPNITAVGSVGVPSDVPPLLRPFFMRLVNWRYTTKLSNSYVIWDPRLCPHIVEFCRAVSEMESEKGGMERWFRANNYLVSPLRYAASEAAEFMWFWENGYRCTIGQLSSIGGTTPVTLAGSVGLSLAETLAISYIMHVFHGDRGLNLATVIAPLDMRSGFMPYGRPEQLLTALAQRDVCRYIGTADEFALGTPCGAKDSDLEAGLTKGFSAGLQLTLLSNLHWSFGKYSTDEVIDPRMMLIENEQVDAARRFIRGVRVDADALDLDMVREVGPGGTFLTHPHTARHFRDELWTPRLMSGENLESWKAAGSTPILEKARLKVLEILDTHRPCGIRNRTERELLKLIVKFAAALGISAGDIPELPQ